MIGIRDPETRKLLLRKRNLTLTSYIDIPMRLLPISLNKWGKNRKYTRSPKPRQGVVTQAVVGDLHHEGVLRKILLSP